jgi:hypothetical protein
MKRQNGVWGVADLVAGTNTPYSTADRKVNKMAEDGLIEKIPGPRGDKNTRRFRFITEDQKRDEVLTGLTTFLADGKSESEVMGWGEENGMDDRTLNWAKKRLGVITSTVKGVKFLRLPPSQRMEAAEPGQGVQDQPGKEPDQPETGQSEEAA